MSISSAELPELSRTTGTDAEVNTKLKSRLQSGLLRISFYVIPSMVVFFVLGESIVGVLYQTGKFAKTDSIMVSWILAGYSVGLFASTQGRLCTSVFWALRDTRTPAKYALYRVSLSGLFGFLITFPVRKHFGFDATVSAALLGVGSGIAGWMEFLLIRRNLTARIGAFGRTDHQILKTWGCAVIAGVLAFACRRILPDRPWLGGIPALMIFCGLYLIFANLMRIYEAQAFTSLLKRKISL